jgi:hypothetical protein
MAEEERPLAAFDSQGVPELSAATRALSCNDLLVSYVSSCIPPKRQDTPEKLLWHKAPARARRFVWG